MIAQTNQSALSLLSERADDDQLATNSVIVLEVLYSAQDSRQHKRAKQWLSSLVDLGLSAQAQRRAVELQTRLAAKGQYRIPINDLLIAADAEQSGAELLHYDGHFDLIAEISDLRAHWIVPRGEGH